MAKARQEFTTEEWKCFLLRSIGIESGDLSDRQRNALLLRMVPFVERNYNLVELGPRGTGKSHLFQQVSPYAHLISGGKATVARSCFSTWELWRAISGVLPTRRSALLTLSTRSSTFAIPSSSHTSMSSGGRSFE